MNTTTKLVLLLILLITPFITSADKLSKDEGYLYIATFNVFKLGAVAEKYKAENISEELKDKIPKRIDNIADVLAVGEFELVALQEVAYGYGGEAAMNDLIISLRERHGLEYEVIHSDHIGKGLMKEMISFLYDPTRVTPHKVNADSYTSIIEIPGRDLALSRWSSNNFDFTIISAHLAWSNKTDRIAGYEKINDILHNPAKYSDDPDVIILGDFNRYGDSQRAVEKIIYDKNKMIAPNITIFDPNFNSEKRVKKSLIKGKGIPDDDPQLLSTTVSKNTFVYDAFFMTKDVDEEFDGDLLTPKYGVDFGIIAFDQKNGFGYQDGTDVLKHDPLKLAYSDHRPLWLRFNTSRAEDKDSSEETKSFFTTPSGKKYHIHGCPRIENSSKLSQWETIEAVEAASYEPCQVCIDKNHAN